MAEEYYKQIIDVQLPPGPFVLALPGWYPTWQDSFPGDFIQRQVRAAALTTSQVVLYISKDLTNTIKRTETRYVQVTQNLIEIIVIYPARKQKVYDVFYSNWMYVFLLFKYGRKIKKQWGKPALLHSYIVIRGGLGGMLLGRRWKLPVILSEHWTIYYPEDPGFLLNRNYLFRSVVKRVFSRVHYFLAVTESLKPQVIKLLGDVPSTIVPNVVDTDVFCYRPQKPPNDSFRFIHISTMTYQKNPAGLLRSFKKFNKRNPSSCLWMVGPYPDDVLKYTRTIGLNASLVHFTGPVKYEEVALLLNQSNAFVLFSRYENLPCVVLEALCCGLPVISTAVGGLAEVINIRNGILLENENEEQLTAALQQVFINYSNYNIEDISAKATGQYNFQQVGKLINDVYNTIANTKQASMS